MSPVGPRVQTLPSWAALTLAGAAGIASAGQTAANGVLAGRIGSAALAATVNTVIGAGVVLAVAAVLPSTPRGWRALRRAGLPWWVYLGGLGGAVFVTGAAYAVPVLGVAAFTVAQVAGSSVGGLAVDRAGLAPVGRLALTGPRVAGAALGVAAVAVAQLGRTAGELAIGMVVVAVVGGVGVAAQAALNGRLSAASSTATGTAVNFALNVPVLLLFAAAVGAFAPAAGRDWPGEWYLYVGGVLGGIIVASLVLTVRAVGVLRTGLAVVAGQLLGALVLDAVVPGGPRLDVGLAVGVLLTMAAVLVAGWPGRAGPRPDDGVAG